MRLLTVLLLIFSFAFAQKADKLTLSGPIANVSHPFFHMIETGALDGISKEVEFVQWNNPDELRAQLINKQVDFVAIPTNVAANLYNKGVDIKLLNVSIWGILDIVSRDFSIETMQDLKGKEIAVPFRGDMPDIIFEALLHANGMQKDDLTIKYYPTPPDAVTALLLRQVDTVLLAEPATSMVMRKLDSFPINVVAPKIKRVLNLQQQWQNSFGNDTKLPIAGIATNGDMDKAIMQKVMDAYKQSLQWYKNNPKKAARLSSKYIKNFKPKALEDSIGFIDLHLSTTQQAKADLELFFSQIMELNPRLIGNKMPNEAFYK